MVDPQGTDPRAAAKRAAGRAAADAVPDGARIGLGTGSTVTFALERLAERAADEHLRLLGVPTSHQTARRARALGLPLTELSAVAGLDLTIDGADEIDPTGALVKGGGGALTREKIVAAASRELLVIVSADKCVEQLGSTFPLPIEILEFGWRHTARHVAALGLTPELRSDPAGEAVRTDNGNLLLDAHFGPIDDLPALEAALDRIPGVIECGLFLGMAHRAWIGSDDGSVICRDFVR